VTLGRLSSLHCVTASKVEFFPASLLTFGFMPFASYMCEDSFFSLCLFTLDFQEQNLISYGVIYLSLPLWILFLVCFVEKKYFLVVVWSLNSGSPACLASALPLATTSPLLFWLFFQEGSPIFAQGQAQTLILLPVTSHISWDHRLMPTWWAC
jgi:hypothetical protein